MTTGALIFAFNNEKTDYVQMAAWSAERIRQYLNIPVAVVTDCQDRTRTRGFDRVIETDAATGGARYFEDYQSTVTWHNAGRTSAYELSPWDQTLVLDADYVVNSDMLLHVLAAEQEFLCFKDAYDLSDPSREFLTTFGRHKLPMYWATAMMFRRGATAQWIFESMTMIRANWQHYRDLYGIFESNYRNDYALSIALALVNGHNPQVDTIPWKMASVLPEHRLSAMGDAFWQLEFTNADSQRRKIGFAGIDFHAMGKRDLGEIIAETAGLSDLSC